MNKKDSLNGFRTIAVDNKHRIRAHGSVEIKEVKKMKKREIIKNAESFADDFMFSDMEE